MREVCGTIRPRKPIIPEKATEIAVRTETNRMVMRLNILTSNPRCLACSSPRRMTLNSRAYSMNTTASIRMGMIIMRALVQDM